MDFSTMVLTMWFDADEFSYESEERVIAAAVDQSLRACELGFNPWYTEHHFRGPWHSSPLQLGAYLAAQIPAERYLGFGVLSAPYYHPVRLVEQMNLLDHLTKGRTLYGVGSGFAGVEAPAFGLADEHHQSGRAAREGLEIMDRLWAYEGGEPYEFETELYRGRVVKPVVPSPYRRQRPTIIRTGRRDEAVIESAQRGLPAFLGTFGADLTTQAALYHEHLAGSGHPPEVVEECLRWSTVDLLSVVVAETEQEAAEAAREAEAEQMERRRRFLGNSPTPVVGPSVGPQGPTAAGFAKGTDFLATIAGTPETLAAEIQRIADLGINHVLVRFIGEWSGNTRAINETSMRLFSEQVMPRFTERAASQLNVL
ncbi:MAG TPA: LLM class flavin-dependent oxidoreductase [Solirubrobacteraceae bacterium]|nr:LLM class flavin-dependent oxidoreductase [Solirubrobacteraceae bacterium]